jgi:hypothetical protein
MQFVRSAGQRHCLSRIQPSSPPHFSRRCKGQKSKLATGKRHRTGPAKEFITCAKLLLEMADKNQMRGCESVPMFCSIG